MFKRQRTSSMSSSFGPDGRRAGGSMMGGCGEGGPDVNSSSSSSSSSLLRQNPTTRIITPNPFLSRTGTPKVLLVMRAPIMNGLTCSHHVGSTSAKVLQPFRRPKEERRSKQKHNDEALKQSTLGMARRMDGMQKILSRSGMGLHFKLQNNIHKKDDDGNTCSESSDEEEAEDRPFEPLKLWTSPHNGAEPMGLPTRV